MTVSTIVSSIPSDLASALGASPASVVNQLYSFGASPSNAMLENYAINLLENSYANISTADAGFSVSDLIDASYQLGPSPNASQTWGLACELVANATQSTFTDSPLFTINAGSLSNLLEGLSPNATTADVNTAINNLIAIQSYVNYPYVPSSALSGNFVNSQNNTMLIIFGFSSIPDEITIAHVKSDVENSGLQSFGTVYVTGGTVLT